METRQVTEYKVFALCLANMRGGVDKANPVASFDDLQKLKSYYASQLAGAPWTDEASPDYPDYFGVSHPWNKVFKKGSPLEWYNPAHNLEVSNWQDVAFGGVVEQWGSSIPTQDGCNVPFNPI